MCKRSLPPVDAAHLHAATAPPPPAPHPKSQAPPPLPTYTRADLARHNTPTSAWCAVHNVDPATGVPLPGHAVLDVTAFAAVHPGGDLILLAAGRDASVLFETYHPRGVPPKLVARLTVGTMAAGSYADTLYSWRSDFYRVLKRRVVRRLEERQLARRGSTEIWVKAALLLGGFWGCLLKMYAADCAAPRGCAAAAAWAAAMGVFAALIGVNVQHDGNHGAFATSRAANKAAGWTLDMIGASAFTWELQHMLGHHPYTNVLDVEEEGRKGAGEACGLEEKDQESDPDVFSSFPLMRMHPFHAPSWFHRYQHLYAPFLFAFMTLGKVFQQDYEVALSKRLYHIDATCRYGCVWNVVRFWSMKFITMVYMMALPVYFHGVAKGVALFTIGHFACGELLATMFIVNHVIEGISYAQKGGTGGAATAEEDHADPPRGAQKKAVGKPVTLRGDTPMEKSRQLAAERHGHGHDGDREAVPDVPLNDWAAIQCQTSVNWAPGSWFWNHFSGGLSHQIEHHLFPSICHTNYAYFHDVVEATCREYGVPYQSEPSLRVAYGKMLRHLKHLGRGKGE